MTPLRWAEIKRIYCQALETEPAAREAYLVEACAADEGLLREVQSLLWDRPGAPDLISPWTPIDWSGRTVGHFRVLNKIAGGGMGVVYKAQDFHLKRYVALKVLAPYPVAGDSAQERLLREARAAASIEHPNVCTVYEVSELEGQIFLAMALIEGQSLSEILRSRRFEPQEAIIIAIEVAEGLHAAHRKGIIHRDIKSANIMLDSSGRVKILDFGLARLPGELITRSGTLLGTPAYMSPEQALGKPVDQRSDIWSLGVVLYEMVSGTRPFQADSEYGVIRSILEDQPKPLSASRDDMPAALDRVVEKALAKNPDERQQSVEKLMAELRALLSLDIPSRDSQRARPAFRTRWKAAALIAAVLAVMAIGGWQRWESSRRQWAFETALPQIDRLDAEGNRTEAFQLALQAEPYLRGDLRFEEIWSRISIALSIETTPPGATVSYRRLAGGDTAWRSLGTSPIHQKRVPADYYHFQVDKTGFARVERAVDLSESGSVRWGRSPTVRVPLPPVGEIPDDMVLIPGGGSALNRLFFVEIPPMPPLGDFLLDKYEVTNRDFLRFVEAGGYERPDFWKHEFVKAGELISWAQAMREFRDATGRPGPAGWELGRFPAGQAEFPVGGVSWYEAAAYAEFVGRTLPTVLHWTRAVDAFSNHWLTPLGNFSRNGPRPVRGNLAMGPFGSYDAAGNVKEWCWNQPAEAGHKRFILGGGWDEAEYLFREPDARDAFERLPTHGFRCARYLEDQPPSELLQPIHYRFRDYSTEKPVSDQQFQMFRRFYEYDPPPLDAHVESVRDGDPLWRKATVSFRAAYGDERVSAHLLLPKQFRPPYQTVVVFPAVDAVFRRTSDDLTSGYTGFFTSFLATSGRAVVYPIYKGMYERGTNPPIPPAPTRAWRDLLITQYRDLARTIDYLETREDIDQGRIAYFGLSLGAAVGPVMLAVEQRLKTGVFCYGGFYPVRFLPEADPINFSRHVTLPLLVINGRLDHAYPVQSSQVPFFRMLGTPEGQKRRVLRDGGHSLPQNDVIRETLAWLDDQMGPVGGP